MQDIVQTLLLPFSTFQELIALGQSKVLTLLADEVEHGHKDANFIVSRRCLLNLPKSARDPGELDLLAQTVRFV